MINFTFVDPSRMYLPPKIDSVASSDFGDQIDASNNSKGYGEIALVQDNFSNNQSTEVNNYGVSTKTTDGSGDTDQKLPLSRNSRYNTLTSGDSNMGRLSNKNSVRNLPGTDNYGSSSGTTIPNNGITALWGRTDNYEQKELLATAQSQGLTRGYYNQVTDGTQFGQNLDFGNRYTQNMVQTTNLGYDNTASSPDSRSVGQKSYDRGNNRNIVSSESSQILNYNSGYENTLPYPYTQIPVNSGQRNVLLGTNNYEQQRSHSLGIEKNYRQISTKNNGYNQDGLLNPLNGFNQGQQNQQVSNSNGPPNFQTPVNEGNYFHSASNIGTTDGYKKEALFIGANGFGQSQTAVSNNYGPTSSQSSFSNRNHYDQNNGGYYRNALIRPQGDPDNYNSLGYQAFSLNKENYYQNLVTNRGYTQEPPQNSNNLRPYSVEQNPSNRSNKETAKLGAHSQSASTSSECNCGTPTDKPQKGVYNNNGIATQILGQISFSSTPSYEQGTKSSSIGNINLRTKSSCGVHKSKIHSTLVPKDQYQNSNLPGNPVFQKLPNGANTPTNNGDFGLPGPNAFSNFAPGNQLNRLNKTNDSPTTTNNGDFGSPSPNAFSNFAPGSQSSGENNVPVTTNNSGFSLPGPNAYSNFAPGNQLNQPNETNDTPATTNNGDFGSPGPNAFSNFAPGNQLDRLNETNDTPATTNNSDFGSPGPNAFSNFASGNQLNSPNETNDSPTTTNNGEFGSPSPNAFSNFAPGSQLSGENDIPVTSNNSGFGLPGPNAFSNFAPGNQLNRPNVTNDTPATTNNGDFGSPGTNAFSNFAPENQPNWTNNTPAITNISSFGLPGQNAFSNFAPENQPHGTNDTPTTTNNGDFGSPGQNAFSNFSPVNQPNKPNKANNSPAITNNDDFSSPGQNAFSNFAPGNQQNWVYDTPVKTNNGDFGALGLNGFLSSTPGNQHNQPDGPNYIPAIITNSDYGSPDLNSFTNFAPSNLPSQVINTGNNNCGTSNYGNKIEPVFSTANIGY
jgi:hypothetical protein